VRINLFYSVEACNLFNIQRKNGGSKKEQEKICRINKKVIKTFYPKNRIGKLMKLIFIWGPVQAN
jgi:hypothetical protein